MEVKIDGSVFDVDLDRTRAYYQSNTLCTCSYCRHYREIVCQRYPKLTELLERFGVDAARPDEAESYEQDGVIEYAAVHYTVNGSILAGSKEETRLEDTETLRLVFEPGGKEAEAYYPNEQEEPYFYITVWGVKLSSAWAAAPAGKRSFPALLLDVFRRKTKNATRTIPPIPDDATLAAEMSLAGSGLPPLSNDPDLLQPRQVSPCRGTAAKGQALHLPFGTAGNRVGRGLDLPQPRGQASQARHVAAGAGLRAVSVRHRGRNPAGAAGGPEDPRLDDWF